MFACICGVRAVVTKEVGSFESIFVERRRVNQRNVRALI